MRVSQAFDHGQWLQVKITSVPLLPATSAIDSSRPSTLRIFTSRCGAGSPSWSAAAGVASAAARPRAVTMDRMIIINLLIERDRRAVVSPESV